MGTDIDNEEFDDRDYSRFADRLGECLSALGQLLEQPGFGTGPATIGADLELFLIDSAARPLPRNRAVCAATADPRVNVEPNRCNPGTQRHASLAGRAAIRPLRERLNPDCRPGGRRGQGPRGPGRGHRHLPTLSPADLGPAMMTDVPRYRALSGGLRRLRQDRFRIRIASADPLELADDVGLEAATTSFQVHLRVDPRRLHAHPQRGPAGYGTRDGRVRQLAHLPEPPALGRNTDRGVQAVDRRPLRPRATPPNRPHRLGAGICGSRCGPCLPAPP